MIVSVQRSILNNGTHALKPRCREARIGSTTSVRMETQHLHHNRRTVILTSLVLLGLASIAGGYFLKTAPEARPPNIILIIVDTLSALHLGTYDKSLDNSPSMNALAAQGVRFERAYAAAPWTKPGVTAILTGLSPARHGVVHMRDSVPQSLTTLAEMLQPNGYATFGVVSHTFLSERNGFAQGFDQYRQVNSMNRTHTSVTSKKVTDTAVRWLNEHRTANGKPFFLLAHYFDPHFVYQNHSEFSHADGYTGKLKPAMPLKVLRDRRHDFSRTDVDFLVNLYREEIAFTDRQIGMLIQSLPPDELKNTIIVVTADHGEEFMEHGWIGHTRSLHEPVIRIPLLISFPAQLSPLTIQEPASQIDVLPTIMELAGISGADLPMEGHSLVPFMNDPHTPPLQRRLFSEVTYISDSKVSDADKIAVIADNLKLIYDRAAGDVSLYDLDSDPEEKHSLHEARHADAKILIAEVLKRQETITAHPGVKPDQPALSEEEREKELKQLKSLGYL